MPSSLLHQDGKAEHGESSSQRVGCTGEQDEDEEWIEAYGWNDAKEQDEGLGDLFADPDPYETFHFTFTLHNNNKNGTIDISNAITVAAPNTLNIMVRGFKAENGQTLNSTGLTLWRASTILCEYLLKNSSLMIQNKSVLELGAGLGICGILAYKLGASCVILTDGDTETLKALRQNVASNVVLADDIDATPSSSSLIQCKQLRWGRNLDRFACSSIVNKYQVILGSDVIYAQEQLEPLFTTVFALLDPNGTFLLAYSRRNVSIDCVLDCAKRHGFSWTEPDDSEGVFQFHQNALQIL